MSVSRMKAHVEEAQAHLEDAYAHLLAATVIADKEKESIGSVEETGELFFDVLQRINGYMEEMLDEADHPATMGMLMEAVEDLETTLLAVTGPMPMDDN